VPEDHHARQEPALAPVPVAERAAERDQRREGQKVIVTHDGNSAARERRRLPVT
jgi:hypothetical protein